MADPNIAAHADLDELTQAHGHSAADILDGIWWLIGLRWLSSSGFALGAPVIGVLVWLGGFTPVFGSINEQPFPMPVRGQINVPFIPLIVAGIVDGLLNLFYSWRARRWQRAPDSAQRTRRVKLLMHGQVAIDLIIVAVLTHYFGTFEFPFVYALIFHMVVVASVLTPRAAYLQGGFALLLITALANLEYYGIVPHRTTVILEAGGAYYLQPDFIAVNLITLSILMFVSVFLTNHLRHKVETGQRRLKSRALELASFHDSIRLISSSLDIDSVFERVMQQFSKVYEVSEYALHLTARTEVDVPETTTTTTAGSASTLRVPMRAGEREVGVLEITRSGEPTPVEVSVLETIAKNIALAAINSDLYAEAEQEAMTDGLTGLINHRHFYRCLEREMARARLQKRPLSVVIMDIDHFKGFNDTHGHLAGDQVLREVAQFLEQQVRESDIVARYGGEEMVVLLGEAGADTAGERAELIRRGLDQLCLSDQLPEGARHVTVSAGVATLDHNSDETASDLMERADRALYAAKEGGRNRIAVAGSGGH